MDQPKYELGQVMLGDKAPLEAAMGRLNEQPIDQHFEGDRASFAWDSTTTIAKPASVTGPGTFFGKATRTLNFEPSQEPGWRFDRSDQDGQMPFDVSVRNVWTTARNIVLRAGSPHNYMRMVEHIIALKVGMGLDNLTIRMDSGDPPLFDRSSMDLVEAIEEAGITETGRGPTYLTVKEPVMFGTAGGSFLLFLPAENNSKELIVDCAVDFKTAIGKQRIMFPVNRDTFRHGALARTNCSMWQMLFVRTLGLLFADTRNIGYNFRNIVIAGPRRYVNKPELHHEGRSLEAAWHRACLDLLAAIALIDRGRLAGTIVSYKAGHSLDVDAVRGLYHGDLLREM
jgi:UDP-3-O-[3-hydroxymyristoyl] N-acetylglucosamine deacetylase